MVVAISIYKERSPWRAVAVSTAWKLKYALRRLEYLRLCLTSGGWTSFKCISHYKMETLHSEARSKSSHVTMKAGRSWTSGRYEGNVPHQDDSGKSTPVRVTSLHPKRPKHRLHPKPPGTDALFPDVSRESTVLQLWPENGLKIAMTTHNITVTSRIWLWIKPFCYW